MWQICLEIIRFVYNSIDKNTWKSTLKSCNNLFSLFSDVFILLKENNVDFISLTNHFEEICEDIE